MSDELLSLINDALATDSSKHPPLLSMQIAQFSEAAELSDLISDAVNGDVGNPPFCGCNVKDCKRCDAHLQSCLF